MFSARYDVLPIEQQICWKYCHGISREGFVLYGGTALALRLGHRKSVDFDFFSHLPLDRASLFKQFPVFEECERLQDEANTLTLSFLGKDFQNPVKISFFGNIDFGRVGTPEAPDNSGILVASLDDIMALKLKVILQRVEEKDYFDVAAMIEHGVSLTKGLAAAAHFFGTRFQPTIALHTLVWFEGLSFEGLPEHQRHVLIQAVSALQSQHDWAVDDALQVTAELTDEAFSLAARASRQG